MADSISINLADLANYTPTEGLGSNALLKQDGFYTALVTKIVSKKSKTGNPMFTIQQIVQDEDEKGQNLISNVLCGGKDSNGEPLARQLGDFLLSAGFSVEQIRAMSANGTVDSAQLTQHLMNKRVFISCEAEAYEGKLSTKVANYIAKTRYDEAVAANAHRRPHKAVQSFASAPAGAVTGAPNLNIGGPAAASPATNGAAPASNPLAALQGLQLKI